MTEKKGIIDKLYDKGLYCIPVKTKEKVAKISNWNNLKLSKEEMFRHLNQDPEINIAVITGQRVNLIVLDFDNIEGERGYQFLIKDQGINTYTVKTPRGYHSYFKTNNDYTGAIGSLKGFDIKSQGGYVLSIGSINSDGLEYTELNNSPIIDLPKSLENLLLSKIKKDPEYPSLYPELPADFDNKKTPIKVKSSSKTSYRNMEYLDSWITGQDKIKEGERNITLFNRALYSKSAGWTEPEVLKHIKNVNNKLCCVSLPDDEIKEIVKSCFKMKQLQNKGTHNKRTPNIGIPGHIWDWMESLDSIIKLKARSLYLELEFITTWHGSEFDEIAHYNNFFADRLGMDRRTIKPILDLFKKHKLITIRKERLKHGKNFDTAFLTFHPENFKGAK